MDWLGIGLYLGAMLGALLTCVIIAFYSERKLSAFIQDRLGPSYVGPVGTLQAFADLLKLLQKEQIIPTGVDKPLFLAAPLVVFAAVFTGYAFLPFNAAVPTHEAGLFLLLAIVSIDVVGVFMAGWGSNNKYALLGAMRGIAQIISYELPLSLVVLAVVVLTGSLDLGTIMAQQGPQAAFGGLTAWNVVKMPFLIVGLVIFYITMLAESNRAPFDLPEGESELVAGFMTEYSGFRWAVFFLAEYSMMILLSAVATILFLGGGYSPFPDFGPVALGSWTNGGAWFYGWFFVKTILLVVSQVWVRWSFPRLRIDQLMYLCWQVLTPFALSLLGVSIIWRLLSLLFWS